MQIVQVLPQDIGWVVEGCGQPLYFRSGRWAEATARRLARALSAHAPVELLVADRSGRLAGRLRLSDANAIGALEVA